MERLFQSPWDICAVLAVLLYALIATYVKRHQPHIWNALGKPSALYSGVDVRSWELATFLLRFKFFNVRDVKLVMLCVAWYLTMIGTFVAVVLHILRIV